MYISFYFNLYPFKAVGPSGHRNTTHICAGMFFSAAAAARLCTSAEPPSQIEI